MRSPTLLGLLLLPSLAAAQPGLDAPSSAPGATPSAMHPRLPAIARNAHDAGARGDCVDARTLAVQVYRIDPAYYRASGLATDPAIATCRPVARLPAAPQEEPDAIGNEVPEASDGRLIGEALLGGLLTVGGAIVGGSIGAQNSFDPGPEILGAMLGGSLGAASGVWLAGSIDSDSSGSFAASLGCAGLGALGSTLAIFALAVGDGSGNGGDELMWAVAIAGPTVGAMAGYHLTRKVTRKTSKTAVAPVRPALPPMSAGGVSFTLAAGTF